MEIMNALVLACKKTPGLGMNSLQPKKNMNVLDPSLIYSQVCYMYKQ